MAFAGVHIEWIKETGALRPAADGASIAPGQVEIPHAISMTAIDLAIGADPVEVPAGVYAMELSSPSETPYRYAVGETDQVAVPAAHGKRVTGLVPKTVGVRPGQYVVTAADTELP